MKSQNIQMQVQAISPELARKFLEKNTRNRPLNSRRAALLAEAIKRGEWMMNGDAIRFSDSGVLLDGQHRLTAIAISGLTVDAMVVRGLPDSVFDTIDVGGAARTTGSVMALMGEKNYNRLAALTRMYFVYEKTGDPTNGNPDNSPTTAQQIALAEDRSFSESVDESEKLVWCRKNVTPTLNAFCIHVFKKDNEKLASEFFRLLNSGAGLEAGSPVLLLRERLAESKSDKKQEMSKHYALALICKAYKLFREGAHIKQLRVRIDGDSPEKNLFVL